MIKYFEDELKDKVKDTHSEILYAHWCYDKKAIPLALQAVSRIFPHYSLHDESHSLTIINNIIRIIGKENIKKLSAIDIWLILEAAYCHDLGMIVPSDDIVQAINSSDFIFFFKGLINNTKCELHQFANKFNINEKNQIEIKEKLFDVELIDGIKYILAEYFRKKHAERSNDFINHPDKVSLSSPRGAIPPRIIKILGDICSSHTKDFDEVMKLSFSEVGIDIEDAHPRFVACMLRIGDLLDLDNNRFSEVMLRTLTKVPFDTLIHKAKHLSIESFRIDGEIEIFAHCDDYDAANVTQHWFSYLNSEITSQMNCWNKIVPLRDFFSLPMIGDLKVELTKYEFIDGKIKPAFSIDRDKALEIFQGVGLYKYPQQCIREILQNAVDASLIRLWLEHHEEPDFPKNPKDKRYLDLLSKYPISVNISPDEINDNYEKWKIEIIDNGIGISKNEIKYLINTGSSSNNSLKNQIIDQMPLWMKPSGIFGIGFQSIFLLTNVALLETKSYLTDELQTIELNSPRSLKNGDVLIWKETNSAKPKGKYGCKISFNYHIIKSEERNLNPIQENAREILKNFDPFSQDVPVIEIFNVLDEVNIFEEKSIFPIYVNIGGEKNKTRLNNPEFDYYDNENLFELNFGKLTSRRGNIKLYFKNQPLQTSFSCPFTNLEINILTEDTSNILTLSRNEIRLDKIPLLMCRIYESIYNTLKGNFDKICPKEEDIYFGSMLLNTISPDNNSEENRWKKYKIKINDKQYSMGDLLEIETIRVINDFSTKHNDFLSILNFKQFEIDNNLLKININMRLHYDYSVVTFILSQIKNFYQSISIKIFPHDHSEVTFTKQPQEDIVTETYFINILEENHLVQGARLTVPCNKKYGKLRLKDNVTKKHVYAAAITELYVDFPYPQMLSPYIHQWENSRNISRKIEKRLNDTLFKWVFDNRFDVATKLDEIKETYEIFCTDYDEKILK